MHHNFRARRYEVTESDSSIAGLKTYLAGGCRYLLFEIYCVLKSDSSPPHGGVTASRQTRNFLVHYGGEGTGYRLI